ncbi:Histone-lysine N-methyltransferase [Handroanthus impetiginosus]|uniref:Enhancer of polycomb-like protein n=1 Tax=Handroanthus impetiginosus TaxID=429701 RepID=A0A2G9HA85_9LAMI|nr:Histone-lysine N-methyltransferase [Handroanthus impetiginosus]
MENSTKKSGGAEIPRRNRSLDLKSLYESKFSVVAGSKKKVSDKNDQEDVKKKKRKSRKEVPLSCFESDVKRSRKDDEVGVKSELGFIQKSSDSSKGLHGISLALGDNGSCFNIPKRPRGTMGRKKMETNRGSDPLRHPNSVNHLGVFKAEVTESQDEAGPSKQLDQLVTIHPGNDGVSNSKSAGKVNGANSKLKQKKDSKPTLNSSSSNIKLKQKVGADEVKEYRSDQSGSVKHVVEECNPIVDNEDTLPRKCGSNSKKKKNLVVDRAGAEASTKKCEPSVGSSVSDSRFIDFLDDDDDDEENLEQNAARMLSSRFDPSCTGFSSKRTSSVSQTAEGLSFSVSSAQSEQAKSLGGGETAEDNSRALRPRREDKGNGVSRKRRHFYEILPRDLDPHWVLKRRIKVFWPLDESWYYGIVEDYHSETKLHHIKYDDRDEEWVNLQEEKFKLLLLPSEVPHKSNSRKRSRGDKGLQTGRTVSPADDDSCTGNYLDSEPIASWLASQSQRIKALPKSLKRRRTSQKHLPLVSSLSSEKTDSSNGNVDHSKVTRNKPDGESAVADYLLVHRTDGKSNVGTTSRYQSDKYMVYVRRKYRKKSESSSSVSTDVKACETAPWTSGRLAPVTISLSTTKEGKFCYGCLDSDKQVWSFDDEGALRLNDVLLESKEFRLQISLPVLPLLEFSCGIWVSWLLHDIFMLQHGVLMTTSPSVFLEMLFVDSNLGLRCLLFEGCLQQALAFVFSVLIVFSQSHEQWTDDMKLPVTSIRFQLSSVQDQRKQHVFAFYSFSRLKRSKWLYLESKVLQHCHLIKQLPVSECTYDNIKELECRSFQQCKHRSSNEGFKKNNVPCILPRGVLSEARKTRTSQTAFSFTAKPGKVPQFALSFSAAPTFFLTLHLQLLMEHSFACINCQHLDALRSSERSENGAKTVAECAQFGPRAVAVQDLTTGHEIRNLDTDSSGKLQKGNPDNDQSTCRFKEFTEIAPVIAQSHRSESSKEAHEQIVVSVPTTVPTHITSPTSNRRSDSSSGGMLVEVPSYEQVDMPFDRKSCISKLTSDLRWNIHDGFVHNSNPGAHVSSWQRGKSSLISSPHGHHSYVWPDEKPNFMSDGFSNGPKKLRTQVQYTLPFVGHDFSAKQKIPSSRSLSCKRIRRASLKRISEGSGNNQKSLESLTCIANVLVTDWDNGWRECGAHIVLEVADHNEWRLAVKVSGVTKYLYKVKHILQPGSTNRYSHAMMWKGGKDWVLEFPDRSQWMLFKEMHEECYNRNIRAASVKNIPIPGVHLVEEGDDYGTEVPFVRNPIKYFRQVQTDVDMAMDPSHTLYDMDSDDERWLMANRNCTDEHKYEEISEEFLEKALDMFEKVSYAQRRDNFTDTEIAELVTGRGSVEAAKVIYEHWRRKREKMGMPLIRHLQPPLWERYQQQLKEWEHSVARGNSLGRHGKVPSPEKPAMFAFCLKPRGLEVPNKGSKQRSHRKFPVSVQHNASSADPDSLVYGRRSNGHAYVDEKLLYTTRIHDFFDVSPSLHASTRVFSPRDRHFSLSNDFSDWKGSPKFYKNKPKKLGSYPSFHNQQMIAYNQRTTSGNRNGVHHWNSRLPELPSQRPYYFETPHRKGVEQFNSSDIHEFQLRDASSAAHHAANMAKLKRERAQKLLYRADLAIHKLSSSGFFDS